MNNCCFYQHPNLMRALDMHTTVMDIMVNVLGGSTEAGKQISTSQVKIIPILNQGNRVRQGPGPNRSKVF